MPGLKFIGFGWTKGDRSVTNDEMNAYVDTNDSWIRRKTGIESRTFADSLTNADMAVKAGKDAMKDAGIQPFDIGALLVCTATPDRTTPSVSNEVAGRLGLPERILSMDINGACSGFTYGCITANALLRANPRKKVLIIGSEKLSSVLNMKDRTTCILFGDGAGAAVAEWCVDGEFQEISGVIPNMDAIYCDRFNPALSMQGQEVYHFAVSIVPRLTLELLETSGYDTSDIDWYVFHQANKRIIDSAVEKLKLDENHVFCNISETANTSAASIPLALGEMREKGLLHSGMRLLIVGFGAGLTYGAFLTQL